MGAATAGYGRPVLEPADWRAWRDAAADPAVDASLRGLYQRVDRAIADRGPRCWASGKCCRFDAYGHALFVTGLEAAWFLDRAAPADPSAPGGLPVLRADAPACPFQAQGLCGAHAIRPLGCRVFFCQLGTADWQHALYERFLAELRTLHERHGLAYRYMEWRWALAEGGRGLGEAG